MSEFLAVVGLTLAHGVGSPITGGVFVVTSTPSTKVFGDGKAVYKSPLAYSFSGGNAPGATPGTVAGSGTISASSTKCKSEGVLLMRETDSGTLSATGQAPNPTPPPPTIPVSVSGPVEISSAGQTKAKGE